MIRSLNEMRGYTIHAIDGDLGTIKDFLFDDRDWVLRYLVIDTGGWLRGRQVLVSPVAITGADWPSRRVAVMLTKDEIENSPGVEADQPVSRQAESGLAAYYGWPVYWGMHAASGAAVLATSEAAEATLAAERERKEPRTPEGDPNLRSEREIKGYDVVATDQEAGEVEDLLVDDDHWTIRYLVVDTKKWLPGRKVLIAPKWAKQIHWADTKVEIDLKSETIKNSPEWDPAAPVTREYEMQLFDFYRRAPYWEDLPRPKA